MKQPRQFCEGSPKDERRTLNFPAVMKIQSWIPTSLQTLTMPARSLITAKTTGPPHQALEEEINPGNTIKGKQGNTASASFVKTVRA